MLLRLLNILVMLYSSFRLTNGDCSMLNYCNGHGTCQNSTSTCDCFEGWGSSTDISFYKAPDCSLRVCPSGRAWADVPTGPDSAHAETECSNRGTCDRQTGICSCFTGFTGEACQRNKCPNDCSGHGVCMSMKQMARMENALPLGPNTYYEGYIDSTTWDEDKIYGCVCDSSWPVGLGAGQRQEPEWFGPDCSLRHCPSADNPRTKVVETNCTGVPAKYTPRGTQYQGQPGNLCQVDCANQGICDYATGVCHCFSGQYGVDCATIDPQAVYDMWNEGETLEQAFLTDDF